MTEPTRPRPLRLGRAWSPSARGHFGAHWLCRNCWHPQDGHHQDGRCYSQAEIRARMAWWERTGIWPSPDESCTSPPHATRTCCVIWHLDETRTGWRCRVCERFYPTGREPWLGQEDDTA